MPRYFSQFGPVDEAVVIMERDDPGRSRGFGFVTYATMDLAQAAIDGVRAALIPFVCLIQIGGRMPQAWTDSDSHVPQTDGKEFMGRNLKVNVAQVRHW